MGPPTRFLPQRIVRERNGAVEGGLDSGGFWRDAARPGDEDAGEGLGDEEAVPRAELPGAFGKDVEGPDVGADEGSELGGTGFGDEDGAARAVGGEGAVMAGAEGAFHVAQAGCSATRAGAANGEEAKTLDGAGDEFAVEAFTDKDGDVAVAKAPGAGEQGAVPEDVDSSGGVGVAGGGTFVHDVLVAERHAEAADDKARQAGDDGES